ncbi:MAG: alpha/beta hydrolase [Rhizobiales bacterium]|nr:alpha/beta hydrolase [Hyphomicrobiales bacterium]
MPKEIPWCKTIGAGSDHVMALHGWFGDHRAYESLFDILDTDRFTYVFPDIRGYGRSRDIAGDYAIGEVARDALALADHLGWDAFHIIGHSMGGKAAQKVAIDGGGRIKSAVALTPVPAPAMPVDEATFGFFSGVCRSDETALALIGDSVGQRLTATWMKRLLAGARETARPEAFEAYMRSFIRDDLSAGSAGVTCPMLVLAGEHDNGVRKEMVAEVFPQLFPNARLTVEILANAGHYPMDEIPVYLVTRIEQFLTAASA